MRNLVKRCLILALVCAMVLTALPQAGAAGPSRVFSISDAHLFGHYADQFLDDEPWQLVEQNMEMNLRLLEHITEADLNWAAGFESLTDGLEYTLEQIGAWLGINAHMNERVLKESAQAFFMEFKGQEAFQTILLDMYEALSGGLNPALDWSNLTVDGVRQALLEQQYGEWIPKKEQDALLDLYENNPALKVLQVADGITAYARFLTTAVQMQYIDVRALRT